MNSIKKIELLPLLALTLSMFTEFPVAGIGLTIVTLVFSIVSGNRIIYKSEDLFALTYFVIASFAYFYLFYVSKNLSVAAEYTTIVLFPIVMYFTTSSIKTDSISIVKFLLVIIFVFSILSFFRDVNGNFTIYLSENIYMHQRQTDTELTVEPSLFFRNATLVAIWLITSFIFALSLYNYTKKKIYLFLMLIAFVMVFLSNTRTALGIGIVIIAINLMLYKQGKLLLLLIVAVPILYLIVLSVGNLYQSQIDRFSQMFDENSSFGLGNRTDYWQYTINLISQNIWGYGHLYVVQHIGFSSHSEYLGQAVSVGLLAAAVYFLFVIVCFFKRYVNLRKHKSSSIWNEIACYLLIVYLVNGLTEQISAGNRYWMALLFMGLGWSKVQYQKLTFNVPPIPVAITNEPLLLEQPSQ